MENPRLIKALSEKMYLLSAIQDNEWIFNVRAQSTNVYEQHLSETTYSCSCPDHQTKNTFCKHLLFLVVRVGKQFDLGALLIQRPKTSWKKNAFQTCSKSWIRCLSHLIKTSVVSEDIDNQCAICFDDYGTEEIVKCGTMCHKKYHKICIEKWLERSKTCPMCRTKWNSKTAKVEEKNEEKEDECIEGSIIVENKETANNTDIVISFDTTGSMYPCLAEVRRHTANMTERLFREIPSLRVAIITHGDYCDGDKVISQLDFTTDQQEIKNFIQNASSTSGGDYPECYELVLRTVKSLSWNPNATMKSLILIGDAPPHEKNENPQKIDWREEAETLKNRNIQIFSVQCLNRGNSEAFNFYSEVAEITNGYHVFLDQFSYIKDMIQAICFKQYNIEYLEQFEKEIQEGTSGMSNAMRLMFDTMLGKKTREQAKEEMNPKRFNERYHRTATKIITKSSKSTTPSLEHESELTPSPPSRFQILRVDEDINIKTFCLNMGITFANGRGFYEFTKPEIIQKKKEIILMDKSTGELYEGIVARTIAGISADGENSKIKPGKLEKYRMFIQSTSPSRKLISGQGFLYEVV